MSVLTLESFLNLFDENPMEAAKWLDKEENNVLFSSYHEVELVIQKFKTVSELEKIENAESLPLVELLKLVKKDDSEGVIIGRLFKKASQEIMAHFTQLEVIKLAQINPIVAKLLYKYDPHSINKLFPNFNETIAIIEKDFNISGKFFRSYPNILEPKDHNQYIQLLKSSQGTLFNSIFKHKLLELFDTAEKILDLMEVDPTTGHIEFFNSSTRKISPEKLVQLFNSSYEFIDLLELYGPSAALLFDIDPEHIASLFNTDDSIKKLENVSINGGAGGSLINENWIYKIRAHRERLGMPLPSAIPRLPKDNTPQINQLKREVHNIMHSSPSTPLHSSFDRTSHRAGIDEQLFNDITARLQQKTKLIEVLNRLKTGAISLNPYWMNSSKKLNTLLTILEKMDNQAVDDALAKPQSQLSRAIDTHRLFSFFSGTRSREILNQPALSNRNTLK